ncbi:MAG: beta-ketoacyl synthase N-terminal-like domain-containing protein, partial [Steroidobacteraceae bacterium]
MSADACDRAALQSAREQIKSRFGAIHGAIVSTVGPLDRSLADMSEAFFRAALGAKIDASVHVAEIFGPESPEFILFFSSMGGFESPGGMSAYATGTVFQDSFAHALAHRLKSSVKVANWGYWGEVGVGGAIPQSLKTRMQRAGICAIDAAAGIEVVEDLLASAVEQIGYLRTTRAEVARSLGVLEEETVSVLSGCGREVQLPAETGLSLQVEAAAREQAQEFERRLCRLLWGQLRELGLSAEAALDLKGWSQRAQVVPLYARWLQQSVRVLREHGYGVGTGGGIEAVHAEVPPLAALWGEWREYRERQDEQAYGARLGLAEAMLLALPDILQGRQAATEVMFPRASMERVAGVYQRNRVADFFNEVLAESLTGYLDERVRQDPQARLRLIEIGAGTGATSALLFERLQPYARHISEYCYTDISKAFLLHAQEQYAARVPYLVARRFDVEQPACAQGLTPGAYDVVVATNVLHATRDIRRALRHAKGLLCERGVVLINEMTGGTLFTHVTFGLLPGWWAYEDEPLRVPGTPALSPRTWAWVLAAEGFRDIRQPAAAYHALGQQIIAACSDGVIRLPAPHALEPPSRLAPPHRGESQISPALRTAQQARQSRSNRDAVLRDKATTVLTACVARVLRMPVEELDPEEPLELYGMDSILFVQIADALRNSFGNVSSTLMFEHRSIAGLAEHFMRTQREALLAFVGWQDGEREESPPPAAEARSRGGPLVRRRRRMGSEAPRRAVSDSELAATQPRDVAIIGLSGRYPQANTLEEYWARLRAGENCIREVPADRWDWRTYYGEGKGEWGTIYTRWGGFLDHIDQFDPLFFGISPREAESMDPQERLFLQEAHACIADAGYTPAAISKEKRVGVIVGVTNSTYHRSSAYWSIANRVSSACNFTGPSLAVDTACSASLTAIHLACESLRAGECDCAVAGGVHLSVDPVQFMGLASLSMLSSGAECRAFGAGADGIVSGEGVGAVLLKPLRRAQEEGDHIYGVIKAS